EAGETASIQVNDGGWRPLATFNNGDDDNRWHIVTYDLNAVNGVQVGFEINGNEANDRFFINYVQIHGDEAGALTLSCDDLRISEDGSETSTCTVTNNGSTAVSVNINMTGDTEYADLSATSLSNIAANGGTQTFTVEGANPNNTSNPMKTVTVSAVDQNNSSNTSNEVDIEIADDDQALIFTPDATTVIEDSDPTKTVQLCANPAPASTITVHLTGGVDPISVTPSSFELSGGSSCQNITVTAIRTNTAPDSEVTLTVTAEDQGGAYSDGELTVTVQDDDASSYLTLSSPSSIQEGESDSTITVTRSDTSGTATIRVTTADRTKLSLTGGTNGTGNTQYVDVSLADGEAITSVVGTIEINGVDDVDMEHELVLLTANGTYAGGTYADVTRMVKVIDDDITFGASEGLISQAFPTALFIASYDWLTNFYDYNDKARGTINSAGHYNDPDTHNFNKIILADSNLFPLITATLGDTEFPNITSRNTDNFNDYLNRSVTAVANYIEEPTTIPFGTDGGEIKAVGMRSEVEWVFVTDPANHNIRRYQFGKGPSGRIDTSTPKGSSIDEFTPSLTGSLDDADTVCTSYGIDANECSGCPTNTALVGELATLFNDSPEDEAIPSYQADGLKRALFFCREPGRFPTSTNALDTKAKQSVLPVLEYVVTVPADKFPLTSFPVTIRGNASQSASSDSETLYVALNGKCLTEPCSSRDPGPSSIANAWKVSPSLRDVTTSPREIHQVEVDFGAITTGWDLDGDTSNGVQLRLSIAPREDGGIAIGSIVVGDDRAFTVKLPAGDYHYDRTDTEFEARWNNIMTFLETVPPRSYPGYTSFRQLDSNLRSAIADPKPNIGYGSETNTTFDSAENVRFKNPRDIDAYRDYFDSQNGGPTYVFVADTMNSRVQVFMNATGSAGQPGAAFPIRPVKVKGPNDIGALAYAAYTTNELAVRPGNGTFGDGRKSDWRPYLPNYISGGGSYQNVSTGKGEFFYPHGVAVDQDPDTKDVYLFVADTFNHRIQVFRDISGVSSQGILEKRFDFTFEAGWGAYPLVSTAPGPFGYKYPKGIDVARFANNSSYLYVVDSKNHRLLKYLLVEEDGGGLQSVTPVAGYGYDGTGYSKTLTTNRGLPLTDNQSLEPGFLNPQDVTTGYSGFFEYTSPGGQGVKFLDNHMVYVTDYARNDNRNHGSLWQARLNMRVMQFMDGFTDPNMNGVFLPWSTTTSPTFGDSGNLGLWQSPFKGRGSDRTQGSFGVYSSQGAKTGNADYDERPGPAENAGVDNVFTERPVGIATLAWNTVDPIDIRVVDITTHMVYQNGSPITAGRTVRIGAASGAFFDFPVSYASVTSAAIDGQRANRIHVFWYNTDGSYRDYELKSGVPPFLVNVGNTSGFMKVVVEDTDFEYSGRTGTQLFRIP
ncbi:hypothetical protein CSA56_17310, partial [candidate division KSB3 bacterium]